MARRCARVRNYLSLYRPTWTGHNGWWCFLWHVPPSRLLQRNVVAVPATDDEEEEEVVDDHDHHHHRIATVSHSHIWLMVNE